MILENYITFYEFVHQFNVFFSFVSEYREPYLGPNFVPHEELQLGKYSNFLCQGDMTSFHGFLSYNFQVITMLS